MKDTTSSAKCAISLPAYYYISAYDVGEEGLQPHNFITIGGNFTKLHSYSLIGDNDFQKQFSWLDALNITFNQLSGYQNSTRSNPSDHQLVINASSAKLKIMFLNGSLPIPPGKLNN